MKRKPRIYYWSGVTVERHEYTCTGRVLFPIERPVELTWLAAQIEEVGRDYIAFRKMTGASPAAWRTDMLT